MNPRTISKLLAPTAIFLLLLLGCTRAGSAEWKELAPPGSGFRALMPGVPQVEHKTNQTPAGNIEQDKFSVKEKGLFLICSVRFPQGVGPKLGGVEGLLDLGKKDILAGTQAVKGQVKNENRITLNGHPGLGFEVHSPEGAVIKARVFAVTDALYEISAYVGQYRLTSNDVPKFLDSFELLDEPGSHPARGTK